MENKGFTFQGTPRIAQNSKWLCGSRPASPPISLCLLPYVGVDMSAKTWDGSGMSQEDFMIKDEVRYCNNLLSRPYSSKLLYLCAIPVRMKPGWFRRKHTRHYQRCKCLCLG